MVDDASYIDTWTVQKTFHGCVVTGKSKNGAETFDWWLKWRTATPCQLAQEMVSLNIVYNCEAPLLCGVVSVCYTKDEDVYKIIVPTHPLFFGVRIALVYADSLIYYQRDPDCYKVLPANFTAWIAGILCEFHDPTVGEVHTTYGKWFFIREWMKTKDSSIMDSRTLWDVFRDQYTEAVQHLNHREAYTRAVEYTMEAVKSVEKLRALNNFKHQWTSASRNVPELLGALKRIGNEQQQQHHQPENFLWCVDAMERMRNSYLDFGHGQCFKSELDLSRVALEIEESYNMLLKTSSDSVASLKQTGAHAEYADALTCALELIKKEYRESDLFVVIDAFTYIRTSGTIVYEISNVKNVALKKTLDRYNSKRLNPPKDESHRIEKAREFTHGENVLSWRLADFEDVLQYHKEVTTERLGHANDNTLTLITMLIESEKQGPFYRKEIGLNPLTRNGFGLEDHYIIELLQFTSNRNTSVEKILEARIVDEFASLKFWELTEELVSGVTGALETVCHLATLLGSNPVPVEPAWPGLPLDFVTTSATFRNPEDVDKYISSYKNFKKPISREWPVTVLDLETTRFNSVIDRIAGKTLKRMWKESVVKIWKEAQERVEKAHQTYEDTINEIVRLAESKTDDLAAVYMATFRKCHSAKRGTTAYDTWWELMESEFVRRAPHIFGHIEEVNDKETLLQQVVENQWKVAIVPDETTHKRWIEDLSYALLQRAHNITAKQLLTDVEMCIVEAIKHRSSAWKEGKENIDHTVSGFYDLEFISGIADNDNVVVSSTEFGLLNPELYRVLLYATRIYGLSEMGEELFNWIADGCGRWMITSHIKEQFRPASSHGGFVMSDNPIECFYGAITTLLFDFFNVYEVCCTQLRKTDEIQSKKLYRTLLRSFPIYGRIASNIRGWSTPYDGETNSAVDVFEKLPLLEIQDEIPECKHMTSIQNIEVTKQVMKMMNRNIDTHVLDQCMSGMLWSPSGPLYDQWMTWRKSWLRVARNAVFDYAGTKLQYQFVTKQQIHSYAVLKDKSEKLADFIDRHIVSRNVIAKFTKPSAAPSETAGSCALSGILKEIEEAINLPEEDEFYCDDDCFDHNTALMNFGFYTNPTFPSLQQELVDTGIVSLEVEILQQQDTPAEVCPQLIKQIADLTLEDSSKSDAAKEHAREKEHQTLTVIVKTKNVRRHLIGLTELFHLVESDDHE